MSDKPAGGPAPETLFNLLFEHSTDLLALLRVAPDERIFVERFNPAAAAFFGRVNPGMFPERWRTDDMESLFRAQGGLSAEQVAALFAPHHEAIRSGRPVQHTSDIHGASGERLVRRYWLNPLAGADGRVAHLLFHGVDLTELELTRRRAEESGKQFARLFEITPVPLSIVRMRDSTRVQANAAWLAFHGRNREQSLGRSAAENTVWADEAERSAMVETFRRDGRVPARQVRMIGAGGAIRTALVSFERIAWEGEDCAVAATQDVTELEDARHHSERSAERFSRLFELTPIPLSMVRLRDNRRLLVNPAWLQLHGVTLEQALVSAAQFSVWADASERARLVEDLRRDGAVRNRQVTLVRGERRLDAMVSALSVEMDGEDCMVTATLDVTELQSARREAELQRERFEALFRLSPNPSSITALGDGRYLDVNQAWARAIGYAREEMLGRTSVELGLWESAGARAEFAARVRDTPSVSHHQARFRTRGGESREMFLSTDRIDWEGVPAILASMNDVTELSRALAENRRLNESLEQKVRDRTAELETALREIEAFSYTVSHDLRAPLRHVSGFAGLLLERASVQRDPEAVDYAERLGSAAKRLGGMVDSLLEYSRLGRKQISSADVDLGAEVKLLVAEFAGQAAGRHAGHVRWDVGPLPVVRGDPTLLRLLLQNLLDNALKYSRRREEAVIEIGARKENTGAGAHWVLHVRDNGVGFDMRYTGKLFGVFQRLHGEREFEGTGIGLAHAARIVERHGGRIWCDAAVDRGATFWFTLPAPEPS